MEVYEQKETFKGSKSNVDQMYIDFCFNTLLRSLFCCCNYSKALTITWLYWCCCSCCCYCCSCCCSCCCCYTASRFLVKVHLKSRVADTVVSDKGYLEGIRRSLGTNVVVPCSAKSYDWKKAIKSISSKYLDKILHNLENLVVFYARLYF